MRRSTEYRRNYPIEYFTDRPSTRLSPYNRLQEDNYGNRYYANRIFDFPYFKDTCKTVLDKNNNEVILLRKETYSELNDLIIDPRHFFENTNLSKRVELTPSRLGADPGNAISNYLYDGARTTSDLAVQMTMGRSRDRFFLKNLKKRTPLYA